MLDTPCSEVVWKVLATHSIRQFPLSLPLLCVTVCHRISTGLYLLSSRASITLHWNSDIYLPQCRQEIRRLRGSVKGTGPHSIRQFPLHFPSCALPCAIAFQLDSTCYRLDLVALHTESPTSTCPNAGKRVGGCCKMIWRTSYLSCGSEVSSGTFRNTTLMEL